MSKSKKYKTFTELKGSVVSSRVSENRIAEMITDLDDFVKKIKLSQKKVDTKGEINKTR
jgi:predicted transcriptional regulator